MANTTRAPRRIGTTPVPVEQVAQSILFLRGQRVILDRELAAIYGVETRTLNQAVKRNIERFPEDFMFQLTREEAELSRSQSVILNSGRGQNIKYLPFAFTEHGAIHAANVLSSPRAVEMGIYVVRAFVKLREVLASNKELAQKLDLLERKLETHDQAIVGILNAIRELMNPPQRPIGFTADLGQKS
jgi:ORF6N domain